MENRVLPLGNIYGYTGGNYAGIVYDTKGLSPTLLTMQGGNKQPIILERNNDMQYRARKLTPTEVWRLMGLTKYDIDKCYVEGGVSNSQLYKQAGNGIVTNCVKLIFEHLYKSQYDNNYVCSDETNGTPTMTIVTNKKIDISANILFSGIGCQERGIDNTNLFNLNVLHTSDIDKDAILSYACIHCGLTKEMIDNYSEYPTREEMIKDLKSLGITGSWDRLIKYKDKVIEKYWLAAKVSNQTGDISKIDKLDYADLWTYSFPCTDISLCGKVKGIVKGKTRSGLLYEVQRLLETSKENGTLPKYLLLENVKNLISKKFKPQFDEWIEWLDELGYNTYWQVLNAYQCGDTPQHRERVFALSIRKDIDKKTFEFPKPFYNRMCIEDILEEKVDDKYYFDNNERAKILIQQLIDNGVLSSERERVTVDLTINKPREIKIANCIPARYDNGVCSRANEGTGVIELRKK